MQIVQSFWSKPYEESRPNQDWFGRAKGGWIDEAYHWMAWTLSAHSLRTHYDEVHLVTDSAGAELLQQRLRLPYTHVSTALDNIAATPTAFWAFGKLVAYAMQERPFLHVDGDFFIWKRFPKHLERAALVAQQPERRPMYADLVGHVQRTFPFVPAVFRGRTIGRLPAVCAGIMGGRRVAFFTQLLREVEVFLDRNKRELLAMNSGIVNVLFEQFYAARLATTLGHSFTTLYPTEIDSFDTIVRLATAPVHPTYIHMLGPCKSRREMCRHLAVLLASCFPAAFARVRRLFPQRHDRSEFFELPRAVVAAQRRWLRLTKDEAMRTVFSFAPVTRATEDGLSFISNFDNQPTTVSWDRLPGAEVFETPCSVRDVLHALPTHMRRDKRRLAEIGRNLLYVAASGTFEYGALRLRHTRVSG